MSSHNALRFKVIYQDFRDVIIQLRRLSKTEQHGGVRERIKIGCWKFAAITSRWVNSFKISQKCSILDLDIDRHVLESSSWAFSFATG